jgi:UDP-N-acetylglucosamine--N-acetylmuramyl-(pentapeptide) pyrophosphoryl-undecaprenol N-acetylglucosamine transferase
MKVLIAVGGGGHFSPALSVIDQKPSDWKVLLVGRKHAFEGDSALSLEYQTAQRLGIPFQSITTGRFQRRFTKHTLGSLAKMPLGLMQAKKIIRQFMPDVVLSFGGYVSVPVILAAAASHVPIVIHEQTLQAGLANKIAAKFAAKICISWEASSTFFPKKKTVLTGNPLRKEFLGGTRDEGLGIRKDEIASLPSFTRNDEKLLYITGGSGGAHGINVLIEGCLEKLLERFVVIHQTGDAKEFSDFERLTNAKSQLTQDLQKNYYLKKFIDSEAVTAIMHHADIVIARSGINTVTELLFLGKPCLLIPLPYGQRNEQLANALFVKKIGLAEVIDQLTTAPDDLFEQVNSIASNLEKYRRNKEASRKLIHTDAAQKIITEVVNVYEKETGTAP